MSFGSGDFDVLREAVQIGEYRIVRELGRGGQGIVYQVAHVSSGRAFALKLCLDLDLEGRQRFTRESRLARGVSSPGLVRIHDFGHLDNRPYYVMDLCQGDDLSRILRHGPLEPTQALRWIAGVAESLAEIHALGIVHRDVKPANLVLDGGLLRLTDFGLARPLGQQSLTATGDLIGTPAYMAPEQALTVKDVDARADVYSLGAVLFECLTGAPPFRGATFMETLNLALSTPAPAPSSFNSALAPYDRLLGDALAKEPGDRIVDALGFKERVESLLRGEEPTGTQRQRLLPKLAAGLAVGALVVGVLWAATGPGAGLNSGTPTRTPTPTPPGPVTLELPSPTPESLSLEEALAQASDAWAGEDVSPELLAALDSTLAKHPANAELQILRAALRHRAGFEQLARADLGQVYLGIGERAPFASLLIVTLADRSPFGETPHVEAIRGLGAVFPTPDAVAAQVEIWVRDVGEPARALLGRALSASACGAPYADFKADLDAARQAAPDDLVLMVWRARLLVGRDIYAEGKQAITWARNQRPSRPVRRLLTRLEGDLVWRMGNLHDSPPLWEEAGGAAVTDVESAIATAQRVWLGQPSRSRAKASKILAEAVADGSTHPRALSLRVVFRLDSPWTALRLADEAIAKGALLDAQLLGFRAFAYQFVCMQEDLPDLARAEWERAFRTSEGAYYRIGACGFALPDPVRRKWIRPLLEAALAREPTRAHAHEYLGGLGLYEGRPQEEILALWRRADTLEPRNGLGRQWPAEYGRRFGVEALGKLLEEIPIRR
ncbi:MAG: serine/threonine protein kinase [Planctomycetes bacterium]|nr:serine/threonine protein kinase [Planctomycetota bacterium]